MNPMLLKREYLCQKSGNVRTSALQCTRGSFNMRENGTEVQRLLYHNADRLNPYKSSVITLH